MDKIEKICLSIIGICLSIMITYAFIYPAYASISENNGEEVFLEKYLIGGIGGAYYPEPDKIVLYSNSSIILRHELNHRRWNKELNESKNSFNQEFDSYVRQYFIWKKVNLTTLDWSNS